MTVGSSQSYTQKQHIILSSPISVTIKGIPVNSFYTTPVNQFIVNELLALIFAFTLVWVSSLANHLLSKATCNL